VKSEQNEELEALQAELEAAKAKLELLRAEIATRRLETTHKDLALAIRHELAALIVRSPIPKGYLREHLRIINDLPNHKIEFHIAREGEGHKLTLSWATLKYLTVLCDGRMVGALETSLEHHGLKIANVARREMLIGQCMKALGCKELKEAA
jgi:hypothetical protein